MKEKADYLRRYIKSQYGIESATKSRTDDSVLGRSIISKIMVEIAHETKSAVGRYFERDHATIIHNIDTINDRILREEKVRNMFDEVLADFMSKFYPEVLSFKEMRMVIRALVRDRDRSIREAIHKALPEHLDIDNMFPYNVDTDKALTIVEQMARREGAKQLKEEILIRYAQTEM